VQKESKACQKIKNESERKMKVEGKIKLIVDVAVFPFL
jgi:hypothetical protein